METPNRKIRMLGGLLITIGLFLSGSMGWLIYWLQDVMAHPGVKGTWNGGPDFTAATFRLFYAVMAFGVAALGMGVFQAVTGRRNKLLLVPVLLVFAWLGYSLWALLSLDNKL